MIVPPKAIGQRELGGRAPFVLCKGRVSQVTQARRVGNQRGGGEDVAEKETGERIAPARERRRVRLTGGEVAERETAIGSAGEVTVDAGPAKLTAQFDRVTADRLGQVLVHGKTEILPVLVVGSAQTYWCGRTTRKTYRRKSPAVGRDAGNAQLLVPPLTSGFEMSEVDVAVDGQSDMVQQLRTDHIVVIDAYLPTVCHLVGDPIERVLLNASPLGLGSQAGPRRPPQDPMPNLRRVRA